MVIKSAKSIPASLPQSHTHPLCCVYKIAADAAVIVNYYATGNTNTTGLSGGILGNRTCFSIDSDEGALVSAYHNSDMNENANGFWHGEPDPAERYLRTTAELKTQSTFVGWNFINTWAMDSNKNNGYPYLRGFVVSTSTPPTTQPQTSEISVLLDGRPLTFDVPPQIINGRTLVPVRGVFEQLGYTVDWEPIASMATLSNGTNTVHITVGSSTFSTNGTAHELDVPAQIIGGRTMLPFRAVLESVG